jgi:hypothetical protein
MRKKQFRQLFFLGLMFSISACFNTNSDVVSPDRPAEEEAAPFTEAYITYPGPNEKWTGPKTSVIHLVTRGTKEAQISVVPSPLRANTEDPKQPGATLHGPPVETVREDLARLHAAMQEKERVFHGCLSPIRVTLIRGDGILIERQGCRGQLGWPRVASEIVNHLIGTSIR